MGIVRRYINRLLSRSARPSGPAASTFGAGSKRRMADKKRGDDYDFEVAREKGRPTGF